MADLTITAASVVPGSGAGKTAATAGATITAGMPVYKDTGDNNDLKIGQADTAAKALIAGIAINGASDGQPITYQHSGPITIGATVATGQVYAVSATSGKIAPYADLITGNFVTIIGVATSTSVIQLNIIASSVAKP